MKGGKYHEKLLTVFTAAGLLVAGGSTAFAELNGEGYVDGLTKQSPDANLLNPGNPDPSVKDGTAGLTKEGEAGVNKHLVNKTLAAQVAEAEKAPKGHFTKIYDENGKLVKVVEGKGLAAAKKVPAKAGASKVAGKVLPKTSAAK